MLWIAGGDSRYVKREDGDRMRRHFPRTRLFTIKGAGHWVHTDAPEIIVTALRRFARRRLADRTSSSVAPVTYSELAIARWCD